MTANDSTTPAHVVTPNSTPAIAKPVITVTADGGLRCSCHTFKVNALLYGGGDCAHVQAMQEARRAH